MNKKELIEYCESLKGDLNKFINGINVDKIIATIEQLDEPQPIKLKDIIVRIKQLDIGTRKVWLNEILNELGSDYGTLKYKAGYEQGKFEGEWVGNQLKDADKIRQELNKPVVPQFVADWIEKCKTVKAFAISLSFALHPRVWEVNGLSDETIEWLMAAENQDLFARAWLDGYTVEEEHKYNVKFKGISGELNYLNYNSEIQKWYFASSSEIGMVRTKFTHEELEYAGFGEVFNSPLFEVEEVQDDSKI